MLFHTQCVPFVDETSTNFRKVKRFTEDQILTLQAGFKYDIYPNNSRLKQLAEQTKLTEAQVYRWHQRTRKRLKQGDCEFRTPPCVCTI